MKVTLRKSEQRGQSNLGWLQAWHSFSFADYYDPQQMNFGPLRVLNEDIIQPGQGFGRHPHKDAEIITYVLEGGLRHQDSLGQGGVIRPGDVQYMSAGSGISHSEFNASDSEPVHLLQIWLLPSETGAKPRYQQRHFPLQERVNRLQLLASKDGSENSFTLRQEAKLYASILECGQQLKYQLAEGNKAWLQLLRGNVALNDNKLKAGDAAAIEGGGELQISASSDAEFLLFDLND